MYSVSQIWSISFLNWAEQPVFSIYICCKVFSIIYQVIKCSLFRFSFEDKNLEDTDFVDNYTVFYSNFIISYVKLIWTNWFFFQNWERTAHTGHTYCLSWLFMCLFINFLHMYMYTRIGYAPMSGITELKIKHANMVFFFFV